VRLGGNAMVEKLLLAAVATFSLSVFINLSSHSTNQELLTKPLVDVPLKVAKVPGDRLF
jgi:hypothetical protein